MKNNKLIIGLFVLCSFVFNATEGFAQAEVFIGDAAGTPPLKDSPYTNVIGSPYFIDVWLNGVVKLADGKMYTNVKLKYDQVLDKVYFQGEKGEIMGFRVPVLEFKLSISETGKDEIYFVSGYGPVDRATEKTYYQKLVYEGNPRIQLLKRTFKKIYESRVYNSAITDKTVEAEVSYYISDDKRTLKKVKLDRKSILAVIGNNQVELEKYIQTNKLNFKKEEDVIKLLTYYNTM